MNEIFNRSISQETNRNYKQNQKIVNKNVNYYQSPSQIKQMMNQNLLTHNNKIGNAASTLHKCWLQKNKSFSKPYSQCTKYIDNLSQNKALIRRGPFNIPLHKQNTEIHSHNDLRNSTSTPNILIQKAGIKLCQRVRLPTMSDNLSRISQPSQLNSMIYHMKNHKASQNNLNNQYYQQNPSNQYIQSNQDHYLLGKGKVYHSLNTLKPFNGNTYKTQKKMMFDNSINTHKQQYSNLMLKERANKDQIGLRNSSNRIIAMDFIKQKLKHTNQLQITRHKLHSLKKKIHFQSQFDQDY